MQLSTRRINVKNHKQFISQQLFMEYKQMIQECVNTFILDLLFLCLKGRIVRL